MRKLISAAGGVLTALMIGIPVAHAAAPPNQICGNGGSGYCINAWNGGPDVRMYYGGYANDYFYTQDIFMCNGGDKVLSTINGQSEDCPFSNPSTDQAYDGKTIVEVVDGNTGSCVGTGDVSGVTDAGFLGSCGNSVGSGAIDGAIDVLQPCTYGSNSGDILVNRYWSNSSGLKKFWQSGGNPNTDLFVGSSAFTCFGGSGLVSP